MSTHQRTLLLLGMLELHFVALNGCAMMHADDGQLRVGDALNIYAVFDNSRDWGPSYLIGAPGHHLGMGARIDDNRTDPPILSGRIDDPKIPAAPSALSLPTVRASPMQADDPATDEAIGGHVEAALHSDPYVYDTHLTVSLNKGDVVLGGFVSGDRHLPDTTRIARKAAGNGRVVDNLAIELGGRQWFGRWQRCQPPARRARFNRIFARRRRVI